MLPVFSSELTFPILSARLAYAEMRLILARMVWNFDMTLAEDSQGFLKRQKAYFVWKKPALNVYLRPVVR